MASDRFRYWLNRYLLVAMLAFLLSAGFFLNSLVAVYRGDLESYFSPVFIDRTHVDWREEADGTWSAVLFLNKRRGACVYVRDQIETAVGLTPDGDAVESRIEYVADLTPGSNRPVGWQRLDARGHFLDPGTVTVPLHTRSHFLDPGIVEGTVLRGVVLHQCGSGTVTVTEWGPVIVGVDEELPYYVEAWVANDRRGSPYDYR